jgi:hypothetical protein
VRDHLAAMTYDGPESVRDASLLRERMAATVDLARRAHVVERDHLWAAREAERVLGRMIDSARAAGDLAKQGRPSDDENLMTLEVLGVTQNLASLAVSFASVPDDIWEAWHDRDADPTQRAVASAARAWQASLDTQKAREKARKIEAAQLRERKKEIERELAAVADRARTATPPDVPPLTDDDTATFLSDIAVSAAAAEEPAEDRDRVNGDRWLTLMRRMEDLLAVIETKPPQLPNDRFADLTVLSARDLARRIGDNLAVWIRTVNTSYDERINR